jgi:hypothetical protein
MAKKSCEKNNHHKVEFNQIGPYGIDYCLALFVQT